MILVVKVQLGYISRICAAPRTDDLPGGDYLTDKNWATMMEDVRESRIESHDHSIDW